MNDESSGARPGEGRASNEIGNQPRDACLTVPSSPGLDLASEYERFPDLLDLITEEEIDRFSLSMKEEQWEEEMDEYYRLTPDESEPSQSPSVSPGYVPATPAQLQAAKDADAEREELARKRSDETTLNTVRTLVPALVIDEVAKLVAKDGAKRVHATLSGTPAGVSYVGSGSFILDASDRPPAWWGSGDNILGAEGEALLIAGPQGTGKSTIAQQLALGLAGFDKYSLLLGYPITPTTGKVLYLAMDRPRQIARSLKRMVTEEMRAVLDERIVVWQGPPPTDLAQNPQMMLDMAREVGATHIIVDSLKDAAVGLNEDGPGALYNRARQTALRGGVDLTELHHTRKATQGGREAVSADSIYGSTWLTAGAGSVLLLAGAPGEPLVDLHHVKQPMMEVGPIKVMHDNLAGTSSVFHATDLVALAKAKGCISAVDAAKAMFETEKPSSSEKEKARRRLKSLVKADDLYVSDDGDQAANRPQLWGCATYTDPYTGDFPDAPLHGSP